MARHRRAKGLLRRTLLGIALGGWGALTLVSWVYVEETNRPPAPPAGLTYVRTDGYRTRYQAWGPATSPHPVVLVHGAFESTAYWGPVAQRLAATTHVEAYDLAGYGYTQRVGRYTTEDLANQLAAFLAARHLRHPVLVGHSLGAGVIARFVLDHPHEAAGLVFLDGDGISVSYPGTGLASWIPNPYRTALYRYAVRNDWLVGTFFRLACGPDCPPVTPRVVAIIQRPLETAGAEAAMVAISSRPIVGVSVQQLRAVGRLGIPTTVIFGRQDSSYASSAAALTARHLQAGAPVMLARTGHLSLWSHPHQVAHAIALLERRVATAVPRSCATVSSGRLKTTKELLCAAK